MKIKEVEKQLSMSSHTLRYYEKMGLINPQRDENGYRDYTFEDIEKLKKIHFLRELEIPIEDIIAIFEQSTNFQTVLEHHIQKIDTQIASLQYIQQICHEFQKKISHFGCFVSRTIIGTRTY
ncbi:MerR family transcriptional regulator [Allocoprobacillus halotolerans]|uniref:MerR family transcriptional regulator n=1 Tax=Allocoprobacillus halotolerans TaxID=2944914 RepID=A0ABY5I5X4_9FIRM|nr:MerR family transcriptional regulator [Allocoprobacillus halotolerans]UTY39347.1 MerR family transcriptional regulator [Allocoprobacillus halotolerans]